MADILFSVAVSLVFILSNCADDQPVGPFGHVNGIVLSGPTCPVQQTGDTNCQPKPVQGVVQFTQDGDVAGTALSDANGKFAADIPVGVYIATVDVGDNIFPICSPVEVEVRTDIEIFVDINCDTGIR